MKRVLGMLIILLSIALFWPPTARAEDGRTSLAVSPPTFELSANPGDKLQRAIRVENLTDRALTVAVERRNFTALGEEGQATLTPENTAYSLASWIAVAPDTATIPAKDSKDFDFTITVPASAEPGGHFGSIVFKTAAPPANTSGGVAVGQEIGSLILLKVAGNAEEKASIVSFNSAADLWEYGPITFETRIKNEGNVHLKPTLTMTITDMFGRKVATIPMDSRTILPGSIRKLTGTWAEKSLFGRYTATLSAAYGDKKQIITATTSFMVIPYKIVFGVGIGLVIVGFLLYRARQRLARSLKVLFEKDK
jgi:hypothetical protein